jgi:anti-sigma regulatory factor (Ser/Thr protein kinase)
VSRSSASPFIVNRTHGKRGVGRFRRLAAAGVLPLRGHDHALVLFSGSGSDGIEDILSPPATWAIDLDCSKPDQGLERLPARLLVRTATTTTMSHDVVGVMLDALKRRLPRIVPIEIDIRLALQEALSNAVMHGNLCLNGRLRSTRDGLLSFTQSMQERLADRRYGRRPVTIAADWNQTHLVMRVEDQGRGFVPPVISQPVPPGACSGRGIGQIRTICQRVSFTNQGRRITMRFRLPAGHQLTT